MILNSKKLYIFVGNEQKDFKSEFYIYDIQSDKLFEMSRKNIKHGKKIVLYINRYRWTCCTNAKSYY